MFRFYNKIYAKLFHYFWLPCPVCGRFFGGHEVKEIISTKNREGQNCQICPSQLCAYKAGIKNTRELFKLRRGKIIF